jgi:hypothetical protein
MSVRARTRGETKMFVVLVSMLVLVVAAYLGFMLGFADPIPAEAWAGFGVVVAVALALAGVAAMFVFRMDRPTVRSRVVRSADGARHVLVVASGTIESPALQAAICERAAGCDTDVLVVAPALNTPLRHWFNDQGRADREARQRLDGELAVLAGLGVRARGELGSDDPLQAIDDALQTFPADEILIGTHRDDESNWLEEDVVERAREAYGVPVRHVAAV